MSNPEIEENPATSAKVNGVLGDEETTKTLQGKNTPKRPDVSIAGNIPDNFKRVSRAIGYAAWLDTSDAWLGLRPIFLARLDHHQVAALAFVALRTLGEHDGYLTASAALFNVLDGEAL